MYNNKDDTSLGDIPLENNSSRTSSTADLTKTNKRNNRENMEGSKFGFAVSVLGVLLIVVNIVITAILFGRSVPSPTPVSSDVNAQSKNSDDNAGQMGAPGPAVTINNLGGGSAGANGPWCPNPNRTYLIQYGHDFGQYEYIDEGGFHRGFFKDLTEAVCEAAGVKCKTVYDKYTNCFTSDPAEHPILGTGLQARYYDVCSGYFPTVERVHFARFTIPFLSKADSGFYLKKGNSFDFDFRNKKFAFIQGWAITEKCVARLYKGKPGVPLTADQVMYVATPQQLRDAVVNDPTIAAGFGDPIGMRSFENDTEIIHPKPEDYVQCMFAGAGQVGRMDNDFIDVWNRGFLKILYNGKFEKVCEEARREHGHRGGTIDCVEGFNTEI